MWADVFQIYPNAHPGTAQQVPELGGGGGEGEAKLDEA